MSTNNNNANTTKAGPEAMEKKPSSGFLLTLLTNALSALSKVEEKRKDAEYVMVNEEDTSDDWSVVCFDKPTGITAIMDPNGHEDESFARHVERCKARTHERRKARHEARRVALEAMCNDNNPDDSGDNRDKPSGENANPN